MKKNKTQNNFLCSEHALDYRISCDECQYKYFKFLRVTNEIKEKKGKIKRKRCLHEWTQPQNRRETVGSNWVHDIMWDISYIICKKCAKEKIIRKSCYDNGL